MKLQQLLEFEEGAGLLDQVVNLIKSECSEYLELPTMFFRGTSSNVSGRVNIRTDRRPRDASLRNTLTFNETFERLFGVKDVRNRSAFVTNDWEVAMNYGSLSLVFPIDGSKLAYHPKLDDSLYMMGQPFHDVQDIIKHDEQFKAAFIEAMSISNPESPTYYRELAQNMPPEYGKRFTELFNKECDKILAGYQVGGVTDIPLLTNPVEFMLFDAPHFIGVHYASVAEALGVPGGSERYAEDVWRSLVKRAKK